ncbi:13609_t:CDS:2, partial [Dentiscutata heterogama]
MENIDYNDSDSESVDKIENFLILNFDNNTYQNIKDKILQLDGDNNEDYDLNSEIEEIILHDELNKGFDEIIPNIPENKDNKYTPSLSEQIYNAFQNPDPNSYSLFDYTTQNTTKGFFNMETCYQHGIE